MPPIEQVRQVLLDTVLPPALLVAVLTGLALLLARWHDAVASAGCALATGGGLILGFYRDNPLPWPPGAPGWTWLLWITLAALATDAIARLPRVPPAVGWALRGMVSAQAGWLLTPAELRVAYFWSPMALGAIVLMEWAILTQVARLDRRGLVPLVLAVIANSGALVLIYAAEAGFGLSAMVLMAVLGGAGIAAAALGGETNGVAAAVAVLLPGLMLSGQQDAPDADFPVACFVLVALSPLALAPSLLPAWRRHQKQGLWALQLVLVLLPLAVALALAAQTGSLNPDGDESRAPVAHPAELAQPRARCVPRPFALSVPAAFAPTARLQ